MEPCTVCGEIFDEVELEPSPSGSGKLVCCGCADEIELDLEQMAEDALIEDMDT